MSPYVIALDPTIANTGWSVWKVNKRKWSVVEHGIVHTEKSAKKAKVYSGGDTTRRWKLIITKLIELNDKYNFSALVAEITPGGARNASGAKSLAGAQAMMITFSEVLRIPAIYVSPREAKKALCGSAAASKEDMMEAADKLTGIGNEYLQTRKGSTNKYRRIFEHAADSIGVFHAVRNHDILQMMEKACED